jgi:ribosomal protein S18 acetylase RimI-like enzyme
MIRPLKSSNLPGSKAVIEAIGLFPAEMLDDMTAAFLASGETTDLWFTWDQEGPKGIAYCAPERMTQGTWNLYLIAVHPDEQRHGAGSSILKHVETILAGRGERLLLVETSGQDMFESARSFYRKNGYSEEARIRDFYQAGEDKIVFWKALN